MKKQLLSALAAGLLFLLPGKSFGQAPDLGSTANFALFTTVGAITNTGITHITGDIGSNSAGSTGFGNIDGTMYAIDGVTGLATADITTLYAELATAIPTDFPSVLLGTGDTLQTGVFHIPAATVLDDILYLDGLGDSNALFIFQIEAAFSIFAGAKVKLINGAKACNVFWKIEGLISMAPGVHVKGTFLAHNFAINMGANDTLEGRALAMNGAISVNNVIVRTPVGCGSPLLTGPAAPNLLSTACYGLFSSNGPVSNTTGTFTFVTGDIGTNVGLTTGFNPLFVTGTIHPIPDGSTDAAATDLLTVYGGINALPNDIILLYPATFGNNLKLTPHTYLLGAATLFTDTLYLDAQGNPNAVFVIKVAGAFTTAPGAEVKLINGAQAKNVFWKTEGEVTMNANTKFVGTLIVNNSAALLNPTAMVTGRVLVKTGALTTNTVTVNANPTPDAGSISGDSVLCVGSSIALAGGTGSWSSSTPAVATVGTTGIVTGVSTGTARITFTATNLCGTASTTRVVTVNAAIGAITGSLNSCIGTTNTLSNTSSGGTWSSSDITKATIGSTSGVVTGIATGTTTISYRITEGCISTAIVTVNASPTVTPVTGTMTLCVGTTTTLSSTTTGGTWSSSTPVVATVGTAGVVSGVSTGTSIITYRVTNGFGCSATDTAIVTVNVSPTVAAITGTMSTCIGTTTALANTTTGGVWSSSTPATGTVSTAGVVTGIAAGTTTISYTSTNGFGCATSSVAIVTVNANPTVSAITGTMSVCAGATTTLANTTTGGTWSSSTPAIATIGTSGVISGIAAGTTTISYRVTNGFGCTATVTAIVSVNANPTVAAITGTLNVCAGSTTTLSNATTGGTWSSSTPAIATVGTSGVVSGITIGTSTISYRVTNGFGCATATTAVVTVNPALSAGTISGPSIVCTGLTITLTNTVTGGTWTSSNANATITSGGVVTGVTAGTSTITYALSSACGTAFTTRVITITTSATAGTLSGATTVCSGSTTTLTSTITGGTWVSSTPAVAAIAGTTGVVTGVSAGTATMTYTISSGCGTATATRVITVNPLPTVAAITGGTTICSNGTTTLANATTGGTWSSSNAGVATVGATGVVTGVSAGTTVITYTVTSGLGCAGTATTVVTVNALPAAIGGTLTTCIGTSTTLTNTTTGGTWSSANVAVATIGTASGIATGVSAGTATISYTASTGCVRTAVITVNTIASAGTITGSASVCVGFTIPLSSSVSGGTWSSSNANATVSSTGVVTGVTAGASTITYTVTSSCGVATATHDVAITTTATAGVVSGASSVCTGNNATFTSTVLGGTWTSSNASIASVVSATGVVSGVSGGTATITYTITSGCGTASATRVVSVNPTPGVAAIAGTTTLCAGTVTTMTNTTTGGVWSSSNPATATISSTGVVSAIAAGTSTIAYVVTNSFGCSNTATAIVTVNATATVSSGSGSLNLCTGTTTTMLGSVTGGTWSSSSTAVATIGFTSGLTTGITAGTSIITYTLSTGCRSFATVSVNATVSPALTVTQSISGTICSGTSVTYTANPVNGGTTPVYTWRVNGTVTGSTSDVLTYTPANGDVVRATLHSNATCAVPDSAVSTLTMTTVPSVVPSMTIASGSGTNVCVGTPVSFTSTSVNAGTTPTFIWKVNGVTVSATSVYTYIPANGDVVNAVLNSSAACAVPATVNSNSLTMTVNPGVVPIVGIIALNGTYILPGRIDTFIAVVTNGGTAPTYRWLVNGVASTLSSATTARFITSTLNHNDSVTCQVTNTDACGRYTFNSIVVTVEGTGVTPVVSSLSNLRLSPNPNKGQFVVTGTLASIMENEVTMEVTNMIGQVVYSKNLTVVNGSIEEKVALNNTLANGIYMLNVRTATENKVFRFVINQ